MNDIAIDSDATRVSNDYHPAYSSRSADIVLLSNDGVKFRVHSSILATASKIFHDMFGMPRSAEESHDDALPMGESSEILKMLLDIIYPRDTDPVLPSMSFPFLRHVLSAAEKYDLARVNHYVRLLAKTELFNSKPLEAYALACTFGWDEDAQKLSLQLLDLDLSSPAHADILKSINSASLYELFQMRWKIKVEVLEVIERSRDEEIEHLYGCNCEDGNVPDNDDWDALEMFLRGELDKYPNGSSLRQFPWYHGDLLRLWNLKCNMCDKLLVRKLSLEKAVIKALDEVDFTNRPLSP
ncbi:hypothetical protein BD410DRAFT_529674 [Rickenella mellea]|uniref:BTB domain-containing protein n=1 Tax=Rickenella mellea TaxID=50990 RepID=A0A4Y7QG59_9AGAM|nr:hypothetical protein BD410DRAFT_529674 [Rickenella mellea]